MRAKNVQVISINVFVTVKNTKSVCIWISQSIVASLFSVTIAGFINIIIIIIIIIIIL